MEDSIIDKINFFEVVYTSEPDFKTTFYRGMAEMLVCTFRDETELRKTWEEYLKDEKIVAYDIFPISLENVDDDHLPVYCIELQNSYKDIEDMVKDIIISGFSGLIK
jgi:hypothetical protein